jgi:hypothetical protein
LQAHYSSLGPARELVNYRPTVSIGWSFRPHKGPYRPNAIRQRDANFQF